MKMERRRKETFLVMVWFEKDFDLVDETENSVTFAIEDDENTYQNYPYHFRLEITYIVTGKIVRTQYKIFNKETNKVTILYRRTSRI